MPRILLVEDESAIADNVIFALQREGMGCVWHRTGAAGLAELAAGGVDLVILDVGLPDQSGFDVCRQIRQASQVPLLFLTARAEEMDRIVGLEIGADDYVTKPFSPREVAVRVRTILRRSSAVLAVARTGTGSYGPLVWDEARHRIAFHGRDLDLSRYEFRLLRCFLDQPGRVFSRSQLMDLVWDEPDSSLDRTVDTHIKTIRAKLREIDPSEVIVTHRGIGYSLSEGLVDER